jgi:hypothetical protein
LEKCEGKKGIVCIRAVVVSYEMDEDFEEFVLYEDGESVDFNGSPVTAVSNYIFK